MKKSLILLFAALLFTCISNAQQRSCNSMENLERQILKDPQRQLRLQSIESHIENFKNQNTVGNRTVYTIPVVFHIVYNTSAQNLTDAQIQSQLNVLNEDFRRLNSDTTSTWSQAADAEVEFCMATVDPSGNATNGITRTQTSVTSFSGNDAEKFNSSGGKNAWPTGDYLNIWICSLNGFLGYAQFPGGPASTDGVTIDYRYTGKGGSAVAPFDLGRTATHEVGHWLNLYHIWGDGGCGVDDQVSDTPASDAANYGCASGHTSCGSTDMVENYMDYSDDACMNLFTQGQKTRMHALFSPGGARNSVVNSTACGSAPPPTCAVPSGLSISGQTNSGAVASWSASAGATDYTIGIRAVGTTNWTNAVTSSTTYTFAGLNSCTNYETRVRANCGSNGSSSYSSNVPFSTTGCTPPPGCTDNDVTYTLVTDNYGSETSWDLKDAAGTVIESGNGYSNNQTYILNWCLLDGCYDFTIYDSYGDGICCTYGNGSYEIKEASGNVLASGGSFGSSETKNFCLAPPPPPCADPTGFSVSNSTNNGASASWTASANAIDYTIQHRAVGTNNWTSATTASTAYTFTGLNSCTDYETRVRANCGGSNNSNYSQIESFSTTGCTPPPGCTDNDVTYTLVTDNYGSETSWDLKDAAGTVIESGNGYSSNQTYTLSWCLPDGCYDFTIYDSYGDGICCAYGNGSYTINANSGTILASGGQFGSSETKNFCLGATPPPPPTGCTDLYEVNNSKSTAASIARNSAINAKIATATDIDWFKVVSTNAAPNIKVDLTNLPADYDMELYRGNRLVGFSENSGTQDEQIIYNHNRKRNYFIKVIGYAGANHADCYDLTNSVSGTPFRFSEELSPLSKEEKERLSKSKLGFSVAPNPAVDQVNLKFNQKEEGEIRLSVLDVSGKQVFENDFFLEKGVSKLNLQVGNLMSGIYLIRVTDGTSVSTEKLIINRL